MVSRLVSTPALVASVAWLAFAGCSNSECLRADCQTSAPVEAAGAVGVAGSAGALGSAGASSSAPISKACKANSECQPDQGELCVSGTCRLSCHSHYDCQGFGECTSGTDSDGTAGHFCLLDHTQLPGQFFTRCVNGDADCDTANDFFCISAGADDLEAYCTTDCKDDSTCAPGLACTPLTRPPCSDDCGLTGTPKDRQCIPSDQIGIGKAYQCASRGVTRNACRPRKFCSSCETDADCLAASDQVCAKDQSGAKICTQLCDALHPSCPWGSAATCAVFDKDLGLATCAHRFGKCVGTGKGCEPCLKDADCGAQGACTSSSFTGERWCVDLSVSCSCGTTADANGTCTGGGCPKSPSGLVMQCSDATPDTANSGVCVGANSATGLTASDPQTGCWPAK